MRVSGDLDRPDFFKAISSCAGDFLGNKRRIKVRVDVGSPQYTWMKSSEKLGEGIVHLQVDEVASITERSGHQGLSLCECVDDSDIKDWWQINSSGRSRESPFESPIFSVIRKDLNNKSKYYILSDGSGELISCCAIEGEGAIPTLWGIATRQDRVRLGFMKEMLVLLRKKHPIFYAQVNENSVTHKYFVTKLRARELATEYCYKYE